MTEFAELRLLDPDLTTVHGILPFQKADLFLHLNEPGSGAVETALDIASAALVESGGYVDVKYRSAVRGGFFIENPARAEANTQEMEGRSLQLSGRGALALLDDGIVWTDGAGANTRTFDGSQAGMLITLIEEAQLRGGLANLTWDFTATNDSDGAAWTDDYPLELTVGTSLLDVVRQIAKTGIDFEILPDGSGNFVLSAYQGGLGSDKSTTVFFRVGINCQEVSSDEAGGDIRNALLVKYKNGFTRVLDSVSIATRRRREKSVHYEYAQSSASATTLASAELELKKNPRQQISVKIYDGKGPRAFVDYVLGDTITLDNKGQQTAYRIRGIHLAWTDAGSADVVVDLNSMILENEIRITQDVDWLKNEWTTAHDAGLLEVRTWAAVGLPSDVITSIRCLFLDGNVLYVGGRFDKIGGVTACNFAKVDLSTGTWTALAQQGASCFTAYTAVRAITKIGSNIYVAGEAEEIWKFDGTTFTQIGDGSAASAIYAMTTDGTNLFVGGDFTTVDSVTNTKAVAKWDGTNWTALSTGITGTVYALLYSGSTLYAGGSFTGNIKAYSGGAWATVGSGLNSTVYALAANGTAILAGGAFSGKISEWSGSAWATVGGGVNNTVYGLAVYLTDIYAVGDFTDAGNRIARYSGGEWYTLEDGLDNTSYCVSMVETTVYTGGTFTTAGTVSVQKIAAYFTSFPELMDHLNNSGSDFDMAAAIHNAPAKTAMAANDEFGMWDSVLGVLKKITWTNVLLSIKTYTDGLYVALTGNQTVAGVKTFTSFPVTPSSAPTTDYQVANKKYVDDNAGGTPTLTANRVAISDSGGALSTSNAVIYDDSTKNLTLGVLGTGAGEAPVRYTFGAGGSTLHTLISWGSGLASAFKAIFANGTINSPTAAVSDDVLMRLRAAGYDGTTAVAASATSAEIRAVANQNQSNTAHGTRVEIYTTPDGSTTLTKVLTIRADGSVSIEMGKQYLVNGSQHTHDAGDLVSGTIATARLGNAVSIIPGGRLSLTSGTPVTTSDVTGATHVYYVPFLHNVITLWNGTTWEPITFTEQDLALGTMTAARGYDVFGYLSGGALAVEKLVWTSATARATAISLQDGRYCKSGDKTRLYLGSFYSTSTTATADAEGSRFLQNMYNRRARSLLVSNSTSHNYNVNTVRAFNNDQTNSDFEYFVGIIEDAVSLNLTAQLSSVAADGNPRISIAVNSTSTELGLYGIAKTNAFAGRVRGGSGTAIIPTLGYSYACIVEATSVGTAPGATFESAILNGVIQS